MKTQQVLERLLDKNPDGVAANFMLKSSPAVPWHGAIRRIKDGEQIVAGVYEAMVKVNMDNVPRTCMLYFDGDDLATLMVPLEVPSIIAPAGGGGLVRGLS